MQDSQQNKNLRTEMQGKVCQSCGMPMQEADFGSEKDNSKCSDYCKYCYQDGKFTFNGTLEEMIQMLKGMATDMGMTPEQAEEFGKKILPELKRWKKSESCKCEICGKECENCQCKDCKCEREGVLKKN